MAHHEPLGVFEAQIKPDQRLLRRKQRRVARERLRNVKSVFKQEEPESLKYIRRGPRPKGFKETEREERITRENQRLHKKLLGIYDTTAPQSIRRSMQLNTGTRIAAGIEELPSLRERGHVIKMAEMERSVEYENRKIRTHIHQAHARKSTFASLEQQYAQHAKLVRLRSRLPPPRRDTVSAAEDEIDEEVHGMDPRDDDTDYGVAAERRAPSGLSDYDAMDKGSIDHEGDSQYLEELSMRSEQPNARRQSGAVFRERQSMGDERRAPRKTGRQRRSGPSASKYAYRGRDA